MTCPHYGQMSGSGNVMTTHNITVTRPARPAPSPRIWNTETMELRQDDTTKQAVEPSKDTIHDLRDVNDLRRLIHVASELKDIDVCKAQHIYKDFMKRANQDDLMNEEEKILQTRKDRLESLSSGTDMIKKELYDALVQTNEQYRRDLDTLERKDEQTQRKLQELERKLKTAQKERDDAVLEKNMALTRLSKEMGTKLNENNPAITDLSDPNRPTKLGEKYAELYDNEWTDALEKLCEDHDEETSIRILLDVLKKCYRVCADQSEKQMLSLQRDLLNPDLTETPKLAWKDGITLEIPKSTMKQLKDCRKEASTKGPVDKIAEHVIQQGGKTAMAIPVYIKNCVELCWLMCIQDPPVVIGEGATVDKTFDSNLYKPYTNMGTVVAYNVWPPLLLHEKGAIVTKGVVQPIKTEKRKEVPRKETTASASSNFSKTYQPSSSNTRLDNHHPTPAQRSPNPRKKEEVPQTKDPWKTSSPQSNPAAHVRYPYHQSTTAAYTNPSPVTKTQPNAVTQRRIPEYSVELHHGRKYARYNGNLYDLNVFMQHFGIKNETTF